MFKKLKINVDIFVMSVIFILCMLEMVVIGICEMLIFVMLLEDWYLIFLFVGFCSDK